MTTATAPLTRPATRASVRELIKTLSPLPSVVTPNLTTDEYNSALTRYVRHAQPVGM